MADPIEGLLGIANVLTEVLPLFVMADPADVGSVVDQANNDVPAVFVYDKYPGGMGFAHRSYENIEELFQAALELIHSCPCADGCPSCVGSPIPPFSQLDPENTGKGRIPDKEAALVILHELLELEPYIPRTVTVTAAGTGLPAPVAEPLTQPVKRLPDRVELKVRQQLHMLQKKR